MVSWGDTQTQNYALTSQCMTWDSDPTLLTRAPREGQGPSKAIISKKSPTKFLPHHTHFIFLKLQIGWSPGWFALKMHRPNVNMNHVCGCNSVCLTPDLCACVSKSRGQWVHPHEGRKLTPNWTSTPLYGHPGGCWLVTVLASGDVAQF